MRTPTTTREIVEQALDRLVELGGGTVYGLVDYLDRLGIRGQPEDCERCLIALWLYDELGMAGDRGALVEVYPNDLYPEMAGVAVGGDDGTGYSVHDDEPWLHLPRVLNELGEDFDRERIPELIDPAYWIWKGDAAA